VPQNGVTKTKMTSETVEQIVSDFLASTSAQIITMKFCWRGVLRRLIDDCLGLTLAGGANQSTSFAREPEVPRAR
jgi:hypothetical protein